LPKGTFVISLDFELHWGVSDHRTIESYYENLSNTPAVVRRLLTVFRQRQIHVTWATVGMLFCRNKQELFSFVPAGKKPTYHNPVLSNYTIAENAGQNEKDDPFHYASSLVKKIISTPGQEMATHTFSHYYCLEPGQTPDQFYYDLLAAVEVEKREGILPASIVFPRNQYNEEYLEKCKAAGIKIYRGNFPSWIYKSEAKSTETLWKRFFRLADTYLPVAGQRGVKPQSEHGMLNIQASCFLRPYSNRLSFLEPLRLNRIKREMTHAAKNGLVYHLWWHPHNFGKNMDNNFHNLEIILDHYATLAGKFEMQTLNMKEIYESHK